MQPSLFADHETSLETAVQHLRRPDVRIAETLPAFAHYLIGAGKAKQTVADFSTDVRQLGDLLPTRHLPTITTTDLQLFLGILRHRRGLTEKSVTRKITGLKAYYRFLTGTRIVEHDAASLLIYPALQPELPDVLSDDELDRMLAVTTPHPLWHALVATLRYAGPKREEALALQRTDVLLDGQPPLVTLRRRRASRYNRDRSVPLEEPLRGILRGYLAQLDGPYLFPIHVRSVHWGLSHYAKAADLARSVSAQMLRDTFAVAWLRSRHVSEVDAERRGLRDAYTALVEQHNRQLLELLGLAEATAAAAIAKYRGLAQPAGE